MYVVLSSQSIVLWQSMYYTTILLQNIIVYFSVHLATKSYNTLGFIVFLRFLLNQFLN